MADLRTSLPGTVTWRLPGYSAASERTGQSHSEIILPAAEAHVSGLPDALARSGSCPKDWRVSSILKEPNSGFRILKDGDRLSILDTISPD